MAHSWVSRREALRSSSRDWHICIYAFMPLYLYSYSYSSLYLYLQKNVWGTVDLPSRRLLPGLSWSPLLAAVGGCPWRRRRGCLPLASSLARRPPASFERPTNHQKHKPTHFSGQVHSMKLCLVTFGFDDIATALLKSLIKVNSHYYFDVYCRE